MVENPPLILTRRHHHPIFTFRTTAWGITLTHSKRNIREQEPTFAWQTNWYVGVYGRGKKKKSLRRHQCVCDTVTQPVGGLSTTSKDFTSLEWEQTASPSSSFTTRSDNTHISTHTQWALSFNCKRFLPCTAFEQPQILAPYEEESKY